MREGATCCAAAGTRSRIVREATAVVRLASPAAPPPGVDARLTPFAGPAPVSPTLRATISWGTRRWCSRQDAAAPASLRFAAVSPQGLRALLPAGWSPVLAVDVAPAGVTFAGTAVARAANVVGLTPGTPLALVRFDPDARAWSVVSVAPLAGDGPCWKRCCPRQACALVVADAQPVTRRRRWGNFDGLSVPSRDGPTRWSCPRRVLFYAPE
jgi:hypothetical protein